MKVAFLSDVHGNSVALEAVLEDIEKQSVNKIYVLGDLCFRGPDPKGALDLIKGLNAQVIKGNADEWIIRGVNQGEVPDSALELMNLERDWAFTRLSEEDLDYLKQLPNDIHDHLESIHFHAFHATPKSLFKNILPNANEEEIREALFLEDADLYIYGHIHKAYMKYLDGKCILNLGSVGLPFDGLAKASYAIVDVEKDRFRSSIEKVSYDLDKVVKQYEDSDYPNKKMMINVIKTGSL